MAQISDSELYSLLGQSWSITRLLREALRGAKQSQKNLKRPKIDETRRIGCDKLDSRLRNVRSRHSDSAMTTPTQTLAGISTDSDENSIAEDTDDEFPHAECSYARLGREIIKQEYVWLSGFFAGGDGRMRLAAPKKATDVSPYVAPGAPLGSKRRFRARYLP